MENSTKQKTLPQIKGKESSKVPLISFLFVPFAEFYAKLGAVAET
jgi:hypothetical protein